MKKLIVLSVCLLAGTIGFAQTEGSEEEATQTDQSAVEASAHGKTISDLAKNTEGGREKGSIISSAARAQGLLHAHANAGFNREGKPANAASGKPAELPAANGKPTTLPPVTPPTTGKPAVTPVGKPAGVPAGKPSGVPGGN